MDTILRLIQHRALIALIGGLVLGLLLGLAMGWWLWPVRWTNATPGHLRSDFQGAYVRWIAEQYAENGDLDQARARLGAAHWEEGQLAETLERLALAAGGQEAVRLRALAQALEADPEVTHVAPAASVWEMRRPVLLVCVVVSLAAALVGGGLFLLIRWRAKTRPAGSQPRWQGTTSSSLQDSSY